MARSQNQKLKLLYLMKLLAEKSDETHPLSMDRIIDYLVANDISAERKSLYDDIEALRRFGMDISMVKGKQAGYFLVSRDFEVAELKLLVDSVQSSQFITEKKTSQLIKKLEKLCSVYYAGQLTRQVHVSGRIKHMNESIYYSVDTIHAGIAQDRCIAYKYFDYDMNKKKTYRHGGKVYCVSPFALTWDNENYYLIGYDGEAGIIKHYRVDRMERISITEVQRQGHDAFTEYSGNTFSMFGGKEVLVEMEFASYLVGVVFDRFGKDVTIRKQGDTAFRISVNVVVSPQFYAWVFGLGDGVKILSPDSVVRGMKGQLERALMQYL